ncbi:MAG: LamG-like jellyroll fold domain-containing protein [Candidatus Latescibacter sp.]|nr:LamG-like jellyroll fold domain-containing protein [Candidatus Latescibacter sp.]
MKLFRYVFLIFMILSVFPWFCSAAENAAEPGLLFYLSGDKGFSADYSGGDPNPSFLDAITRVPDGFRGKAIRIPDFSMVLAYFAPGNIYVERGTLSFFWRSREPIGHTPFHIFQVSYCDHSSIDMAWMRIDYNGQGFDAFVTDINLGRARVSWKAPVLPAPDKWSHIAVAWDETRGIRFYVDGALVGKKDTTAVFYAGLDMFGPANRFINPQHIWANYNHSRGGDLDEVRIYDSMLEAGQIARLAGGEPAGEIAPVIRALDDSAFRDEWLLRYGWNRPGDIPPPLAAPATGVRKVEIRDVYDQKQWVWKGVDGIRETTWPNVYNRSQLTGRLDYFIEPDWNCYSTSGKSVTFTMPDEEWNYLEISGGAFGKGSLLKDRAESMLFTRPASQERTFHLLPAPVRGGAVRFDNEVQEMPIGEFSAFRVAPGREPRGTAVLSYSLTAKLEPDNPSLVPLLEYIRGRFLPDERAVMEALPGGAPGNPRTTTIEHPLPLVHVLIPCDFRVNRPFWSNAQYSYTWQNMDGGLDGIAIDLPALKVKPTHGEFFPLNIQIKDPLWPNRNLLDFSFSMKPGEARTLWLDTRDRILPDDRPMYLTIAGAGGDFGMQSLEGARVRLIFKDRAAARIEHEADRFTQVVDNYGNIVECGPNTKKLHMFERYILDISDLLRVNPEHAQGRIYWAMRNGEQGFPAFEQPQAPSDVPLWAFRQVEDLKLYRKFITWWIDNRQLEDGEFGGGLSDDGDLTNQWPALALMGVEPEKVADSLRREMDAFYNNGMFTNGLNTIQTDELHTYEEGIDILPQIMLLDYGDPKQVERIMETCRALEGITGVNPAGHRHIRSSFFSATKMSEEGVWSWSYPYSYLIFHPALSLVEFNGNPKTKKLVSELFDGLLAHRRKDANGNYSLSATINYRTDAERPSGIGPAISYFWALWRWTGDPKYLQPVLDSGPGALGSLNANLMDIIGKRDTWGKTIASQVTPAAGNDLYRHIAWQVTGDKRFLENMYASQIQSGAQRMPMMTEHHWWVDRVTLANTELQRARLGGVALVRNTLYPGHTVSWRFTAPATGESAAILIPDARPDGMTIIVYNLESAPVQASLIGWDVDPGIWEVSEGIDSNGDDTPESVIGKRTVEFERTGEIGFTFAPKKTTIITLKLLNKSKPYWSRPDLAIGKDDIRVQGNTIAVTVHSLGSVDAPSGTLLLRDSGGKILARGSIPALKAPHDLLPKTADVLLKLPAVVNPRGCTVQIDTGVKEITMRNNAVKIP